MYNIEEIKARAIRASQMMLDRGAPDKNDGAGYNKISYKAVKTLISKSFIGSKDTERLLYHLIRHGGQVETFEDIEYLKGAQEYILEFPIDIFFELDNKQIKVILPYVVNLIADLKKVKGLVYLLNANYCPLSSVMELAKVIMPYYPQFGKRLGLILKLEGYDTPRVKAEYAAEMQVAKDYALGYAERKAELEENAIHAVLNWRSDLEMILVNSTARYDANFVAAVKSLRTEARAWINKDNAWHVQPAFYHMLLENLDTANLRYEDNVKDIITAGGYQQVVKVDYSKIAASVDVTEALELIKRDYSTIGYGANKVNQYRHQLEGEAFMLSAGSCINADDMGLGKTLETLVVTHIQKQRNGNKPVLILCPAAIKTNWVREIFKWLGQDGGTVQVISNSRTRTYIHDAKASKGFMEIRINTSNSKSFGLSAKGLKETTQADYVIINYDILDTLRQDIIDWQKRTGAEIIISDEIHYLKNMDSKRTKAVLGGYKFEKKEVKDKLKQTEKEKAAKKKRVYVPGIVEGFKLRYGLTGTPTDGKNVDMLPLAKFINHPIVSNEKDFLQRYCGPDSTRFGVTYNGATNTEEMYGELSNAMIQRMKHDVVDMPKKDRVFRYVDIDLDSYWSQWDEYVATYFDRTGKVFNEDTAQLTELNVLRNVASQLKIPQVLELADEVIKSKGKVIIFTGYTGTAQAIMEKYGDTCLRITGGMTDKQRDDAIQLFQNDDNYTVIACNYKAASVGITLTKATNVIMADLMWSPSSHSQAEDRAYRIGQENDVTVYYVIATDTHEEAVKRIIDEKMKVVEIQQSKNYDSANDWRESVRAFFEDIKELRESA